MLVHGGDITGFEEKYGRRPIDFSANVSPLGLPEGVKKAIIDSLDRADEYPDPLCRKLRRAIAEYEDCDAGQVLCGAGAADLIFRITAALKPKSALVTAPSFSEYESALRLVGCRVQYHLLRKEENFNLTERIFEDLKKEPEKEPEKGPEKEPEIVFLCQPNNPTGQTIELPLMNSILDYCESRGILLVMDECFVDLLDRPAEYTLKSRLKSPYLVILKAFTKTYAMAGIRLGYCLSSNEKLLADMAACGQPWAVSSVAQAAGIAALKETGYVEKLREMIAEQRPRLIEGLKSCGCRVYGSKANFIFFESRPGLDEKIKEYGIQIRSCANYRGLDDVNNGFYRVAVRTAADNDVLLDVMRRCL